MLLRINCDFKNNICISDAFDNINLHLASDDDPMAKQNRNIWRNGGKD